MSKTHIPINGRYPIIVIEYLGQTMRDLNLTDCDVICWNPSWPIDCKKIDINSEPFNGKIERVLCNLTVMNHDNARHMMCNTLESLSSLAIFTRSDKPLFICSRYVAQTLGLNESGDIVYIREVGE
jgi:hypothetical protein